jgi:hypothetical protein
MSGASGSTVPNPPRCRNASLQRRGLCDTRFLLGMHLLTLLSRFAYLLLCICAHANMDANAILHHPKAEHRCVREAATYQQACRFRTIQHWKAARTNLEAHSYPGIMAAILARGLMPLLLQNFCSLMFAPNAKYQAVVSFGPSSCPPAPRLSLCWSAFCACSVRTPGTAGTEQRSTSAALSDSFAPVEGATSICARRCVTCRGDSSHASTSVSSFVQIAWGSRRQRESEVKLQSKTSSTLRAANELLSIICLRPRQKAGLRFTGCIFALRTCPRLLLAAIGSCPRLAVISKITGNAVAFAV